MRYISWRVGSRCLLSNTHSRDYGVLLARTDVAFLKSMTAVFKSKVFVGMSCRAGWESNTGNHVRLVVVMCPRTGSAVEQ